MDVLKEFEANKEWHERETARWQQHYDQLTEQLAALKEQHRVEQMRQKQRIEEQYNKFLEDFKTKAQSDAEKNISEIERNIQAQN